MCLTLFWKVKAPGHVSIQYEDPSDFKIKFEENNVSICGSVTFYTRSNMAWVSLMNVSRFFSHKAKSILTVCSDFVEVGKVSQRCWSVESKQLSTDWGMRTKGGLVLHFPSGLEEDGRRLMNSGHCTSWCVHRQPIFNPPVPQPGPEHDRKSLGAVGR